MVLKVYNVKGDGNCYYRCIWHIAKRIPKIAEALMVWELEDEDKGAEEIRYCVALNIRDHREHEVRSTVKNLLDLHKVVPDLDEQYPFLSRLNGLEESEDLGSICHRISRLVENTNMMASSLEHQVVESILSDTFYMPDVDCKLIVLTQLPTDKVEDLAEKWLYNLNSILKTIENTYVCVIINENNIHYKYTTIFGKVVVEVEKLKICIEQKVAEDSDSE